MDFYVMTGGPGTGKTTLLQALQDCGNVFVREAAREIIRGQLAAGGQAVPWGNVQKYAALMLRQSVEDYRLAGEKGITCFFDRGIPDTLGYARMLGMDFDGELLNTALQCRYSDPVFILPPWQEIYTTDPERRQDYAEASDTYRHLCAIYRDLGYTLVEIPRLPVGARVNFVLRILGKR